MSLAGSYQLKIVAQAAAGVVPALLLVIFAGLIGLAAMPLDAGRRDYALAFLSGCTDLAAVLVGGRRTEVLGRGRSPDAGSEKLPETRPPSLTRTPAQVIGRNTAGARRQSAPR